MATTASIALLLLLCVAAAVATIPLVEHFHSYRDQINRISYPGFFNTKMLVDRSYWKKGNPILFYPGADGPVDASYHSSGWLQDLAKEFKAMILYAEHRFYGSSLPLGSKSYDGKNIGLLSLENVLNDFAFLAFSVKKYETQAGKIVAIGGGYSGQLALYLRLKYPNIFSGSHVSSAPVLKEDPTVEREYFYPAVTRIFEQESKPCRETVAQAFSELANVRKAKEELHLCSNITSTKDYKALLYWARDPFVKAAVYNYDEPIDEPVKLPAKPVKALCAAMLSEKTALAGLRKVLGIMYNSTENKKCFEPNKEFTVCANPNGCGVGLEAKARFYQSCISLQFPAGSDNQTSMFATLSNTWTDRERYCRLKFSMGSQLDWTAVEYFGKHLESATNVTFYNGGQDPWFSAGILKQVSPTTESFTAPSGKHMHDLRTPKDSDPDEVKQIREKVKKHIAQWLQ